MDKEIILKDYAGEKHKYVINNFENVEVIGICIITGDEICTIRYEDDTEVEFDSGISTRLLNFYDGSYFIAPDKVDEFSSAEGSSYDRAEKFDKEWREQ